MDREVTWAVLSQPSLQWTTTDDFPDSTLWATFAAPANSSCRHQETEQVSVTDVQRFLKSSCGDECYPNVLQPVSLIDGRMPVGFINGGIKHVLQLPLRVPDHMDVGDLQEDQLSVGIETFTFKPSVFSLVTDAGMKEVRAEMR